MTIRTAEGLLRFRKCVLITHRGTPKKCKHNLSILKLPHFKTVFVSLDKLRSPWRDMGGKSAWGVHRWDKLKSPVLFAAALCYQIISASSLYLQQRLQLKRKKKSKQPFFSSVVRLCIRLNADCRHESFRRGDERLLCTHEVIALGGVTDKGDSFCLRRWHRSWGAYRVWLSIARWLVMLPRWCVRVCVWDVCVWNKAVSQTDRRGCEGSWLSPHGYYVEVWMRPERRGGQDWREDSGGKQAGANILSSL